MNSEVKCVIVADEELPTGVLANTSVILGMTLGKLIPEYVGEDVRDASNLVHMGITKLPIPILKGTKEFIRSLRTKLYSDDFSDLLTVDFSDVAQGCMEYKDYIDNAKSLAEEDFNYLGIAIYGNKKKVNKLTGFLPLLR
jgi:hypothetical protein